MCGTIPIVTYLRQNLNEDAWRMEFAVGANDGLQQILRTAH